MDKPIKEETTEEGTIRIYQDLNPDDPRTWDNLGHIVCFHRKYSLGDGHTFTPETFKEFLSNEKPPVVIPLYLYDHGGIVLQASTSGGNPFLGRAQHAEWDSGLVGFAYATKEDIRNEYGKVTKATIKTAETVLRAEVETYNQFIIGDVYVFEVETKNGASESCGGFYGEEEAFEEAKRELSALAKHEAKEDKEQFTIGAY